MKRKFADKYVGERVKNAKQKIINVNEQNFIGDIYFYNFIEVENKMILPNGKCILDNNYKWLEFYDYNSKVKLTAIYDEKNKIVEWYFDIAKQIGKENGIPFEDDLYLDVVVTPEGKILLLDEDELKEALDNGKITDIEYNEAYNEANKLIEKLSKAKEKLKEFSDKYLNI